MKLTALTLAVSLIAGTALAGGIITYHEDITNNGTRSGKFDLQTNVSATCTGYYDYVVESGSNTSIARVIGNGVLTFNIYRDGDVTTEVKCQPLNLATFRD